MFDTIASLAKPQSAAPQSESADGIAALRRTAAKWSCLLLFAVVPGVAASALLFGNPWLTPTIAAAVVAGVAMAAWRFLGGDAAMTRYVIAVATVVQVSLMVLKTFFMDSKVAHTSWISASLVTIRKS